MTGSSAAPPKPPLHLRLAVTGHRSARGDAVLAGLTQAIEAAAAGLAAVARDRPALFAHDDEGRPEPPILTLVSGLAQGGDQMAVEAFRAATLPEGMLRRLDVILPFSEAVYAATMAYTGADEDERRASEAAIAAMKDMAADPAGRFEIADERPEPESKTESELIEEKRWRDRRYAALSDLLVRQGDILIAVWDGVCKGDLGGTAYTTGLALREGRPVLWVHALTGTVRLMVDAPRFGDRLVVATAKARMFDDKPGLHGALARVVTGLLLPPAAEPEPHGHGHEREDSDARARFFGDISPGESGPSGTDHDDYQRLLCLTGAYVKVTVDGGGTRHVAQRPCPSRPLICDHDRQELRAGRYDKTPNKGFVTAILGEIWGHTDAAGTHLGHAYRSAYVRTLTLGAIAVLIGLSGLFAPAVYKVAFVIAELAVLLWAFRVYKTSRDERLHDRFLQAREMAEQFRAAWGLAQLGLAGRKVLGPEAGWTGWAIQAWVGSIGLPKAVITRDWLVAAAQAIRAAVVTYQLGYHRDNEERMLRLHHRLEKAGKWAALYGTALAGILFVLWTLCLYEHALDPSPGKISTALVTIAGAFLPALAAALAGLRYQGDYERFGKRSAKTARELHRLDEALADFSRRFGPGGDGMPGTAFSELSEIVIKLDQVLTDDLEDWRYVYRTRPNPEPG